MLCLRGTWCKLSTHRPFGKLELGLENGLENGLETGLENGLERAPLKQSALGVSSNVKNLPYSLSISRELPRPQEPTWSTQLGQSQRLSRTSIRNPKYPNMDG